MKRIGNLKPGTIFNYAKEKFVVLGPRNGGVLCLLAQSKHNAAFYDGDEKPYNDYRKSRLRAEIEVRFMNKLIENGAKREDMVAYDLDLSETDGSDGYGALQNVLAAPLTLWDYGKYKAAIPNNENGAWWLATPLWAPRSPNTNRSGNVWHVFSGGDYYSFWYGYAYGGMACAGLCGTDRWTEILHLISAVSRWVGAQSEHGRAMVHETFKIRCAGQAWLLQGDPCAGQRHLAGPEMCDLQGR